jgi:glycerate-2-kinase
MHLTRHIVKNRNEIVKRGRDDAERKARGDLVDIAEAAIAAVDPYELVKGAMKLQDGMLEIGGEEIDLEKTENVFVVGFGKACFPMARAAADILGDQARGGVFNLPVEPGTGLDERFIFHVAGHPKPDEAGIEGAHQILSMADRATPRDLFIVLISGGGSALLPYPAGDITLEDLQELTSQLLACGATINEVNTIRKHVSEVKGGMLAQAAHPATVISLIVSDVVGDPVESIASGPTSPDPSTFEECVEIIDKYRIRDKVPESVRKRLEDGVEGLVKETPKPGDPVFNRTTNLVIGNNGIALEAARETAEELGYPTLVLTDRMEGEAREIGIFAASVLNSINSSNLPMQPPCMVLIGGETTVTLIGPGDGGRNQELALAASRKIRGKGLLLSLATDGRDGPTDSAGAVVDEDTCAAVEEQGMSPEKAIADNAEYEVLKEIDAHFFTGYTGTNVCDIIFILVP